MLPACRKVPQERARKQSFLFLVQVYGPRPDFVRETNDPLPAPPEYDVAICGGTLGIFLAAALQRAGLRVAVVERGAVQARGRLRLV